MHNVIIVHFFVYSKTSFSVKSFKLPSFGFHASEIWGVPGGGDGERNKSIF